MQEQHFWEALRKAIAADDMERAVALVSDQMEAWNIQLELEMNRATHTAGPTLH